ncbi:galactokinase [Streptomyces sp. NBC_01808]|uniref:galactokinase n=1 Tax=Streptomyces sp. NBC_01808 TaxID=2975947 RepID=UPI002DDC74B1|nr:galactokinase [Streptomyces sp. NBC_01808]WSA38259.1 galactokinase [Streptomyces sp. NBC_01808]
MTAGETTAAGRDAAESDAAGPDAAEAGAVEATAAAFAELYGERPAGVWAAPGRVNLIGEHTDYNDGFVMPLALPHTTLAAARRRDDGVLRLHSGDGESRLTELAVDRIDPLTVGGDRGGWAAYPAGVVWALRRTVDAFADFAGADIHYESTVPTGAGLSSSAALEVSTALALSDLYGLRLDPVRLAKVSQHAENDFVGVPSGIMDQMASACCTAGNVLYLDTRDLTQRAVPFDLAAEGLTLLVVDTQVKHALGDGEYAERRAGCEAAARELGVAALRDVPYAELDAALARLTDPAVRPLVRHVVTEDRRVEECITLLDAGRTRDIGPVLLAGHASLRDDFRVSCRELDVVVESSVAAGALGARMTGGGFGGSAIVLAETDAADTVGKAVESAFAAADFRPPRIFTAVPGAGARRLV